MTNIYDNEGRPTKEGLRLIARVTGGNITDYDAPCLLLKRSRSGQLATLEWDGGWRLDSTGGRQPQAPEHLDAWELAAGSFYAQFPEGDCYSPQTQAENAEYAERWRKAAEVLQ